MGFREENHRGKVPFSSHRIRSTCYQHDSPLFFPQSIISVLIFLERMDFSSVWKDLHGLWRRSWGSFSRSKLGSGVFGPSGLYENDSWLSGCDWLNSCSKCSFNVSTAGEAHRHRTLAGVQPWQDPGDTLRMNVVSERETCETSLDRSKSQDDERERKRMTRRGCLQQSLAGSGNPLFFNVALIP